MARRLHPLPIVVPLDVQALTLDAGGLPVAPRGIDGAGRLVALRLQPADVLGQIAEAGSNFPLTILGFVLLGEFPVQVRLQAG